MGAKSAGGLNVALEWKNWAMGHGIGSAGLGIADLDGDGKNEIVAAATPPGSTFAPNYFWYILERETDGAYRHQWISDLYANPISCLRLFDFNGDAKLDVCLASGNTIYVYDGDTKVELAAISTGSSDIRGLSLVDVDSDNQKEWVFVNSAALFIYSANGGLEQQLNGYGGTDVAVGNVLPDRQLEIVIGNDTSAGYVLEGRFRTVKTIFPQGLGAYIRLVDLNGDGTVEVLAANYWYYIKAFVVGVSRGPVWQVAMSHDIAAIQVADIEGDGIPELLCGEGQWGTVSVFNAKTGAFKWSIANPEHSVTNIAVANTDGDPAKEVVFGAGYTSTGPDYLYVFDSSSRINEWQNIDIAGPFLGLDYGDVDNSSGLELLYGSYDSESGYDDGLWFVHDALSKALEFQSPPTTGTNWTGLWRIGHANVDGDPQAEVFVSSSQVYDGLVICYDGVTHAEQFRTSALYGQSVHAMRIIDADSDGQLEIVLTTSREHTGATGTYLYVYNASTGILEWRSPGNLGGFWASLDYLRVANVDFDSNLEIIVAEAGGALFVFDGVTQILQAVTGDLSITSLEAADVDGNGSIEIVIGDESGNATVRDPYSGNQTSFLGNFAGRIDGLTIKNVAGSASPDLVFAQGGTLKIVYKDAFGTTQTWSSDFIAPGAGASDSIVVGDVDGDGFTEIFMGDGAMGVRVYQINP